MNLENFLNLPEELQGLQTLASNFYHIWNPEVREIFASMSRETWDHCDRNPLLLLRSVSIDRLKELSRDDKFLSSMRDTLEAQREYLEDDSTKWFSKTYPSADSGNPVAYFSMEFGVASYLKIYSGGLGVLSGDHLKSSSDLGIPLIGLGLFYSRGYFSQRLNTDGWQVEDYPPNRPEDLPIHLVLEERTGTPLIFSIPLSDREVKVKTWKAEIGRIPLYLLDTNLPGENSLEDCEITSELYGGDSDTRIKQEIVLGFGGARLLRLLGHRPSVFHMNEGHSSFVSLERI